MGYAQRAAAVARELAAARQAERQARLREAEREAAAFDAEYLTREAAGRMTGLSPGTLRKLNAAGRGPLPLKLGDHPQSRVRYERAEVLAWIANRQAYEAARLASDRPKFTPPGRGSP